MKGQYELNLQGLINVVVDAFFDAFTSWHLSNESFYLGALDHDSLTKLIVLLTGLFTHKNLGLIGQWGTITESVHGQMH